MEVNVWVNNREKKVKGLAKRTTCHDVITALLYNKTKADKLADDYIELFVLIEQWRECERVLPRNTKIIKIWRSWHNEQTNVKFILRKKTKEYRPVKDENKISRPKTKEIPERITRKKKSGEKHNRRARSVERSDQQDHIKWLNEQISQRISRSNDELLDCQPYVRPPSRANNTPPVSEGLVELVMGQEEQLHNLIKTIRQTDLEIEYYETQMHVCRMHANGKDYVQESYLSSGNEELNEQIPASLGSYEHPHEPSIQKVDMYDGLGKNVTDSNHNEVKQMAPLSKKECSDNDKQNTIFNVPNETYLGKGKKHVTFAKLDSEGQRICADSVESLNTIGLERKTGQIITESTIYETNNPNNSNFSETLNITRQHTERLHNDKLKTNEPLIINSESKVNSNNNVKGILVVNNNNNSKYNMTTQQQTKSIFWDDKNCNDTDSSSDTGLSSMQDSEDGAAVHCVSVTLV